MSKPRNETSLSGVHVSGADFVVVGYALFERVRQFPHIQTNNTFATHFVSSHFLLDLIIDGKEQSPPRNRQMTNIKLIHSFH